MLILENHEREFRLNGQHQNRNCNRVIIYSYFALKLEGLEAITKLSFADFFFCTT